MSKSKIFLYLCVFFIGGIFISSFFRFPRLLWLGFLAIGILLSFVLSEYKKAVVIGLCIISFLFGVFRYQTMELKAEGSEVKKYNDTEKELVVWGVVSAEPELKENSIKYVIKTDFLDDGQKKAATSGNLLVVSGKYPEYRYCDRLKITGKLESPVEIDGFDYEGYLKKEGIYSTVGFSKIELVAKDSCSGFISKIYKFVLFLKQQSRKTINKNLSPPGSSIVSAMILGDKGAIPVNLRDKLSSAGVSHIVAVSGMHIVILMAILTPLLFGLGLWRGQVFYFSIAIIFFYIAMIGFQPSAVRAGIMGGMLLLGEKLGRQSGGFRPVVIVASLMLWANPFLLMKDVGFQLSFLAVMGIMCLGPVFRRWLGFLLRDKAVGLKTILATTISAQIFTLPILIYNFGKISLAAPAANILILPIVSWIMIFGFLLVIAGFVSGFLAWLLTVPCWFLLTYLMWVVDFFFKPWASKTVEDVHWSWLVVSYLIIGAGSFWLARKDRLKFLNY